MKIPSRIKRFLVFLLEVVVMPVLLLPLDPDKKITQYILDVWGLEQGLPQNSVFTVIQTRDDYLWLGTQEGLVRFDGVRFKVFHKGSVEQMAGNWVWTLYEDRKGNLWIGSFGGGLTCLENGRFRAVTGLSNQMVTSIVEDRQGAVWIGTGGGGVNRLNPGSGKITVFTTRQGLAHDQVWSVYEDHKGNLWIGTNRGLSRLKNGKFTTYTTDRGLPNDIVWPVYEDRKGRLWIGTDGGLSRLENGKFANYTTKQGLSDNKVRTIVEDRAGSLWIGTDGGGLNRFNPETGTFSPYTSKQGLAGDIVRSLCEDREGSLWIGTHGGGLNRLRDGKLTTYTTREGLSHDIIKSICQDREGNLWFASDGGGLNRLKDGKFTAFTTRDGLSSDDLICVYEDRQGTLWIGNSGAGLDRLEKGKFTTYTTGHGLSSGYISAICEDRRGFLWLGTYGGGLNRLDPKTDQFTTYTTNEGLAGNFVWYLHEDRKGNLWIGTYGGGLVRRQKGKFTTYTTRQGLSNDYIMSISEDREGTLWIGTFGGLNRFKHGKFTTITTKHGLFDDKVHMVLEDDLGNFWMSCNKGIFRVNKKELNEVADGKRKSLRSISYGEKDGMKSRECNGGNFPVGCKTRDGKLWFPTVKGAVMVDPAHLNINRRPPPVVIEEIKTDNTAIHLSFLPNGEKAVLSPGIQRLEICYTALSFPVPEHVRFKFRLEGFDNNWVDVGTRRAAYYTKLPPGDYTFRVKACNNDGTWNETGAAVSFYQEPYFHQTLWFFLICVFGGLFLVFGIYRLRVRQLRKHEMELERLVAERTQQVEESNRQLAESNRQLVTLNKELQVQRQVAEAANRSKSDFLARMSHEIRTPLNGVIGFIEMLMETRLDEEQAEFARTIARSGEVLIDLVNDILDFSKIEAGELAFDPVDFDPELIAFDVCESFLPRREGKPVEIICRIGDDVPAYVKSDAGRFRQVLVNLMGNAVKFTDTGEIELSLDVEKEEEEKFKLHVRVKDTGIGIPEDKLETIFSVFQQADSSTTRKYGGTGLGLPICKQIAALMKGDVWAESKPGKGSTFHFTAWVDKSRKEPEKEVPHQHLAGKRALVVDDNRTNLEILTHVLKRAGMRVKELSSGHKVVSVIRESFAAGEPFDICVLDIRLPGPGGYELAKQVRKLGAPMSKLPLLAFSSSTIAVSKNFKDSGFNGFLPKPVRRKKLLQMIERLLAKKGAVRDEFKEEIMTRYSIDEEAKHSIHILLAEDHPVNRKLAHFMLSKAGYQLTMVNNGEEAVQAYASEPGKFDLILMDIQMPRMNGKEATKEIRKIEKGLPGTRSPIPIIAMTAESLKGDREKCLKVGMNDYMAKPIKREVVFAMIKKWCLEKK